MSILHTSLAAFFDAEEERDRAEHNTGMRLWYSSDLEPGACERQIYFRLRGAAKKPLSLAEKLMFAAGHRVEKLVLDAFRHAGVLVAEQGNVRPLRPSTWAWSGRFDALVRDHLPDGSRGGIATSAFVPPEPDRLVLVDVKTARANAFKRRDGFPKDAHVWQASAYLHEVRRHRPDVVRAELHYVDRDGSNQPVVVPLTEENGKLVPLEAIIAEEARKAPLALSGAPLPAFREEVVTSWRCNYCAFVDTCKPEQHAAYTGDRLEKPAKKPRTPRKILPAPGGPDPALSSAKSITDAATARGAPPSETVSPSKVTPQEACPSCVALGTQDYAEHVRHLEEDARGEAPPVPQERSATPPGPENPKDDPEASQGVLGPGAECAW